MHENSCTGGGPSSQPTPSHSPEALRDVLLQLRTTPGGSRSKPQSDLPLRVVIRLIMGSCHPHYPLRLPLLATVAAKT